MRVEPDAACLVVPPPRGGSACIILLKTGTPQRVAVPRYIRFCAVLCDTEILRYVQTWHCTWYQPGNAVQYGMWDEFLRFLEIFTRENMITISGSAKSRDEFGVELDGHSRGIVRRESTVKSPGIFYDCRPIRTRKSTGLQCCELPMSDV